MALSEAGDPVETEPEKKGNEVSKRSGDRRKRRSRSRSPGRDRSKKSESSRSSSKHRRDSSSRKRRSSSRDRDRDRDWDLDEDEDGLCKTYRTYRNSRRHYQSRRRSRSRSKSPSTSRPASQPRVESKFDVKPMPQIQASGDSVTFTLPQISMPQMTKSARKVYVGGLPPLVNEAMIAEFFNRVMAEISGHTALNAVLHVYINRDKNYAFVEMRTVEDASNAMALDGILFNGVQVKVRRPADYRPEQASSFGPNTPRAGLNLARVGLSSPGEKIFIGGLPYDWGDGEIRTLLESFGPLRSLDMIKDQETKKSKGYAFAVYQDPGITDVACAALNEKPFGGKILRVHRATTGAGVVQEAGTRVVCLRNAVSEELLRDAGVFEEIMEDMREECGKYGVLERVEIPREGAGVGKVFLEFKDLASAHKARFQLNGRKFDEREVMAVFYAEDKFAAGDLTG